MTDKPALPDKQKAKNAPDVATTIDAPAVAQNGVGEGASDPRQDSFDARFAKLTNGFGQACEQEGVEIAIAIAIHPEEKHPIIFMRGHQYDVGVLLADVLRQFSRRLIGPLNANPNYEPEEDENDE
jgi:hypothetical protein